MTDRAHKFELDATLTARADEWATDLVLKLASIKENDSEALKAILRSAYALAYHAGQDGACME
jgi:hypothetical protein